ncbi:MAG: hypothetical protein H0U66_02335 [Gemmatimonadaceae bacterium]|nr:hypothetical protein [Gemmatimonadaceae bacterium]
MHRNPLYLTALIATVAIAQSTPLAAQLSHSALTPAPAGDVRVRLTVPNRFVPSKRIGSIYAVRNDSLGLRTDGSGDTVMLAMSDISRLEVSRGRHASFSHGLLYGALVGGGIGVVGGAAIGAGSHCSGQCFGAGPGAGALILGVTGVVVGGVLGGVIGALHKSERFKRVSPISPAGLLRSAQSRAIIAPIKGGKALALGLHF